MKYLYLLFVLFPVLGFAQGGGEGGIFIVTDVPFKSEMPKMSTNVGVGLQGAYQPSARIPLAFELKGSFGSYSNKTLQQTYIFDSLSSTTTDVRYTSAMNRLNFGTKVYLTNAYTSVRPFVTPQLGYTFMRSKIVIYDPADEDDCKALDRETTQRYSGFTYGGEAGVEIAMDRLFKGVTNSKHKLYASVSYTQSFRPFEYVNIRYMQDHDHAAMAPGSHTGTSSEDGRDIDAQFVNVSTNDIHEHKIAELYKTDLRFWGINIGYVFSF
jgi:hypothetical protein